MAIGHTYKEFKNSLARITPDVVITQITPVIPAVEDLATLIEGGTLPTYVDTTGTLTGDLFQLNTLTSDNVQTVVNAFYAMKLVDPTSFGYTATVTLDSDYSLSLSVVQRNRNAKGVEAPMGFSETGSSVDTKLILGAV